MIKKSEVFYKQLGHFPNVSSLKFDNIKHYEKFPSVFGGQAVLVIIPPRKGGGIL